MGIDIEMELADHSTRLCIAAATGDIGFLEVSYLGLCGSLTIRDCRGWSLLHHAAMNGQLETLRFLLTHGELNVNYVSTDGWTPVQLAVQCPGPHRAECFEILVKTGADVIDVKEPLKSLLYVLSSVKRDMANEQIAITVQQEALLTHKFCQQAEIALKKARELARLSGKYMVEGQLAGEINNIRNLHHRIQVHVHLHAALQRQNN